MYWISVFTEAAIFAILALGLDVIWGWTGDFDLAFYGYLALGSYMTFVLAIGKPTPPVQYIIGWRLPLPLAILLAMAAVVCLAAVIGAVALRNLRDIYFAVTTLGAVERALPHRRELHAAVRRVQRRLRADQPGADRAGPDLQRLPDLLLLRRPGHLVPGLSPGPAAVAEPVRPDAAVGARGRAGRGRLRPQCVLDQVPRLLVRLRAGRPDRRPVRRVHQRLQPVGLDAPGTPDHLRGDPRRRPRQPPRRHPGRFRRLPRIHRAHPVPAVACVAARIRPGDAPGPHRAPDHPDAQVPAGRHRQRAARGGPGAARGGTCPARRCREPRCRLTRPAPCAGQPLRPQASEGQPAEDGGPE